MDTTELRVYTSLGRNTAMNLGIKAGAKIKVGKRTLWDKVKIDQYLNELTGVEQSNDQKIYRVNTRIYKAAARSGKYRQQEKG